MERMKDERLSSFLSEVGKQSLPKHVAIIMDGNGRWAQARHRPRVFGHKQGASRVRDVVEVSGRLGIEALTLFAFSEENWSRPAFEVSALMRLLESTLEREKHELHKNDVRLNLLGDLQRLPEQTYKKVVEIRDHLSDNKGLSLNIALSYGGKGELLRVMQKLGASMLQGQLKPSELSCEHVEALLDTAGCPELDLLIRTGGEFRISNFLLWQAAYAELYFSDKYWPEFDTAAYLEALRAFTQRKRRFGKVSEQVLESPTTEKSLTVHRRPSDGQQRRRGTLDAWS